ncbi:MAG: ABC transporter substrate-binding protein [Candidatus Bathyarchaeia archaeon]
MNKNAITKVQAAIIAVIIIVAAIVGVVVYFYTLPGAPPPPKDYILIGCVQSLSGPLSPQVTMYHCYYRWIIEDYNATGGLYVPEYGKKLPIKYKEYDDETDINKMLTYTEKLITEDKVDLIFAPCSTGFCYAAFSLYEQYHYPVVALTYGSDIGAEKMRSGQWKYSFHTLATPSEVGEQVRELIEYVNATKSRITSIGILHHMDQHGVEHGAAIYRELTIRGFPVQVYQSYPFMETNFKPLISTLKNAGVYDVVIVAGYEAAAFVRDCMAENYNPKMIITGPSLEAPGMTFGPLGFTLEQVKGIVFYDGWPSSAYNTPELQEWAEKHKIRSYSIYGNYYGYPFPASGVFYAGLQCLFEAVQKVGLDRDKIAEALRTQYFDTILGKMKLRPGYAPDCELAGTITQWQNRLMMEVVWPLEAKSADLIYPKPEWPPP